MEEILNKIKQICIESIEESDDIDNAVNEMNDSDEIDYTLIIDNLNCDRNNMYDAFHEILKLINNK